MESATLIVTFPGTEERFIRDVSGLTLIGRSESCDLVLDHPLVSRRHATLTIDDGGRFVLRDLGSKNGTRVDDRTMHRSHIEQSGPMTFQIGPYVVVARSSSGAEPETLALHSAAIRSRVALDHAMRTAEVDGKHVISRFSKMEFEFLDCLVSAAPDPVPTAALGDAVWGEGGWDRYMVHNLVRRVRRRFEAVGLPGAELVVTVSDVGYRLA